jgi:hypothetical protein
LPLNKYLKEGFIFLGLVIMRPKESKKANEYIFASIDGRHERTMTRGRCI